MSEITLVRGDLFQSPLHTLTNAVNTVGVMGAGIAKEFKLRYPRMFDDYERRCKAEELRVGEPYVWRGPDVGKLILNFPTKQHWRGKSEILWIEQGLQFLCDHYISWELKSLAMPALGCNHGGLRWSQVRPIMERYLRDLEIPVEVYEPMPERANVPHRRKTREHGVTKKLF